MPVSPYSTLTGLVFDTHLGRWSYHQHELPNISGIVSGLVESMLPGMISAYITGAVSVSGVDWATFEAYTGYVQGELNNLSGQIGAISGSTGSGPVYTGTAERTVGGITDGQSFVSASMTQMWDSLIKQEKFPTLTNPSSTFTSSYNGYREVGEVLSITFNSAFNRGSISPQYSAASPYRSGLPNTYQYTGTGLTDTSTSGLTDSESVTGYTVLINGQIWQGRVAYDAGVQPKTSYNNNYGSPLASGSTSYTSVTITGVYPFFATTVTITGMTSQTLASHSSTYVQSVMVAEDVVNKQTADFPIVWSSITGVQFYNTINSTWEWINGSKANSLLTFDMTATTHTIQGTSIDYNRFTHNGSQTGARQLRWYTT